MDQKFRNGQLHTYDILLKEESAYEALHRLEHTSDPKKGYMLGSLFKQARCKIVICVLYNSVVE